MYEAKILEVGDIVLSRITYDAIRITKVFKWGIKGVLIEWKVEDQPFHLKITGGFCFLRNENIIIE